MQLSPPPTRPAKKIIAVAWLGSFLAMALLNWLENRAIAAVLLASFGGTCLLVFAFPESPFSQPRNVVGGHVLGALVGLIALATLGTSWWSVSLAVATAVALSLWAGVVHPPACANVIIVILTHPSWKFLIFPTLTGSVLIIGVAWLYHKAIGSHRYPKYW